MFNMEKRYRNKIIIHFAVCADVKLQRNKQRNSPDFFLSDALDYILCTWAEEGISENILIVLS